MVDTMYLELSIILLSIIAVLVVLILYIVRQTLALNREYDVQIKKKMDEENLWIDRRESDNNILDISEKLKNRKVEGDEEANTEHMVTFTKSTESTESVPHVTENGHHDHIHLHNHGHFHHLHHVHHTPSEEGEHFYENTTSDANEYSEYCVPNCEPTNDQ